MGADIKIWFQLDRDEFSKKFDSERVVAIPDLENQMKSPV